MLIGQLSGTDLVGGERKGSGYQAAVMVRQEHG